MYKLTYNRKKWRNESFQVHFDVPENNSLSSKIIGWFVNKGVEQYHLKVVNLGESSTKSIVFTKARPNLPTLFPSIDNVVNSGFEVLIEGLNLSNDFYIGVFHGEKLIDKVLVLSRTPPLLYVHIAKTAGSTVNKVLSEWFGSSASILHAESKATWRELVQENQISFLSGHIPYKAFLELEVLNGYKKSITFREPYSHVISHLAWIRALALPENSAMYSEHPEYIQKLSDKLANCNLSVPSDISKVISNLEPLEHRLLDNTQTRYIRTNLAKSTVDKQDLADAVINLNQFDYIGVDTNISGFLGHIARDYQFDYQLEDLRENVLVSKFGLDVSNLDIKKALFPLVQFDLELYEKLR